MNRYTKIVGLLGTYYTKEYEAKKAQHKNKIRPISEDTIANKFKNSDTEILIIFTDTNKEMLITPETDDEIILKYLGKKFL